MLNLRFVQPVACAALFLGAAIFGADQAGAQSRRHLRLFNTIKQGWNQLHDGISQVQTGDVWDARDLTYSYDQGHLSDRLDDLAPWYRPGQVLLTDIERLRYIDGNIVDYETPEDFYLAITEMKLLRPDNLAGIDGGLSLSWAQLLAKDGNQYRHHNDWREDAQRWRPAIEFADFWASSHYRDGRPQSEWKERLRVFASLFREQFPGKPLAILIWHRERIGEERNEEWISMRDYVEMGLFARNHGCHVVAFGKEPEDPDYDRAMQYFNRLAAEW